VSASAEPDLGGLLATVAELRARLAAATQFTFRPDLGELAAAAFFWEVNLFPAGDRTWMVMWSASRRCWSRERDDWVTKEEAAVREATKRSDVRFSLDDAMALVPRILERQTERARATGRDHWPKEPAHGGFGG
jgi:hypothetical protein